ncbi:hypothetical protein ACLOJK_019943 [Asimina triloba]
MALDCFFAVWFVVGNVWIFGGHTSSSNLGHTRGATSEAIGSLPIYKFKSKRNRNIQESEINPEGANEGGTLAPGTDKERTISAEDAINSNPFEGVLRESEAHVGTSKLPAQLLYSPCPSLAW